MATPTWFNGYWRIAPGRPWHARQKNDMTACGVNLLKHPQQHPWGNYHTENATIAEPLCQHCARVLAQEA